MHLRLIRRGEIKYGKIMFFIGMYYMRFLGSCKSNKRTSFIDTPEQICVWILYKPFCYVWRYGCYIHFPKTRYPWYRHCADFYGFRYITLFYQKKYGEDVSTILPINKCKQRSE